MKKILFSVTVLAALFSVTAQAADEALAAASAVQPQKNTTLTGSKEIVYSCGPQKDTLNITYGFVGNKVVVAQAKYRNVPSPVMIRDDSVTNIMAFTSTEGIGWGTQNVVNASNIEKATNGQLSQPYLNDKGVYEAQIVAGDCTVNKKATAALPAVK